MVPNRLVYSTDGGRLDRCPTCGKQLDACRCKRQRTPSTSDGIVRISRDSKRRRGKIVTLVSGVPGGDSAVQELASSLKRLCGAGGAVKDGVIEIQGDHREQLAARMQELGYRIKLAGG